MSEQRFTTEEAERIEGELETDHLIYWDPEFRCSKYTRDSLAVARGALRSLAAERDAQTDEIERLRKALRWIESVSKEPSRDHWPVALDRILAHARAALGENQP